MIVVHHTASTNAEQLQSVEKNHQIRGYKMSKKGYHVAYHYFVGRDGTIVNTRAIDEASAHTRNQYANWHSIAIVLAGDFRIQKPTKLQFDAFKRLVTELQRKYHIANVRGHKYESSTSCPVLDFAPSNWKNIELE